MITLIHGPTELLRAETLAAIQNGIADDPEMAALNTLRLDGRSTTVSELRNACDALPFLAERRLVIAAGLLARLAAPAKGRGKTAELVQVEDGAEEAQLSPEVAKGQAKMLLAYLDEVPESTELVFLEEDTAGSGPILRRLQELVRTNQAKIVTCEKLRRNELPDWIRQRAAVRKVKLDAGAIADLAEFVGDELRQLDQELIKLADYAPHRTVTREDVRRLVPATRAASVFEMADALGMGDGATAGKLMRHALDIDGEQPLRLIGMIARQYRLLIQAKALQAQGVKPPEMARTLNAADWTVPKLLNQANRHTFVALERAMARILAADEAIKTGRLSDREAMDVLLAELLFGVLRGRANATKPLIAHPRGPFTPHVPLPLLPRNGAAGYWPPVRPAEPDWRDSTLRLTPVPYRGSNCSHNKYQEGVRTSPDSAARHPRSWRSARGADHCRTRASRLAWLPPPSADAWSAGRAVNGRRVRRRPAGNA